MKLSAAALSDLHVLNMTLYRLNALLDAEFARLDKLWLARDQAWEDGDLLTHAALIGEADLQWERINALWDERVITNDAICDLLAAARGKPRMPELSRGTPVTIVKGKSAGACGTVERELYLNDQPIGYRVRLESGIAALFPRDYFAVVAA